jgi:hypothetical protein
MRVGLPRRFGARLEAGDVEKVEYAIVGVAALGELQDAGHESRGFLDDEIVSPGGPWIPVKRADLDPLLDDILRDVKCEFHISPYRLTNMSLFWMP